MSKLESGVDPVNVAHWCGSTVQNSCKDNLRDSSAPSSKAQISLCILRACRRRLAEPPPHLAPLPICGPKKMASSGPGEFPPRQLSLELAIHGLVDFGALKSKNK